jgi:periplasmic divalent cation tolerance protein
MTDGDHQAAESEACEVIVTAPDPHWLAAFVRGLIEDRLVAAAHLLPIRSLYRWQGQLHDERETRAALHTRREHIDAILARTQREHPFEVPGVVVLPITAGGPAYLRWLMEQTTSTKGTKS